MVDSQNEAIHKIWSNNKDKELTKLIVLKIISLPSNYEGEKLFKKIQFLRFVKLEQA